MWFFLGDVDGVLLWQFVGWGMPYPRTATFPRGALPARMPAQRRGSTGG